MSGGKDSTATALLALEKHPRESLKFVFADTGNEHEAVYEYLEYLQGKLDIVIAVLKADFTREIRNKRKFIARDQRTKRRNGKKMRWTNKAKRRALEVLHPTGNPYLDLCMWKGRFPSRRAQFCTQFLKTQPMIRYQHDLVDRGFTVISWQGVRRDESHARRDVLQIEQADESIWQYRPIADWTAQDVFEMHFKHGVKPNPLYKQGLSRVGCMPCINASKGEIRAIAQRFPEHIERIAEWERMVCPAGKRGHASFFPDLERDNMPHPDIYARVEWAKTARGGRQYDLIAAADESLACASSYGLCE
jgi:3'-phosphoadenosine 5'-phosphosulfate sulfotransferase (PAPS reductase)/FAD synthetase